MRILFFIGGLGIGGTERQIAQLALGLAQFDHQITLVTLYPGGQNSIWLEDQDKDKPFILSFYDRKTSNSLFTFFRLIWAVPRLRLLARKERIDVLYSSLYMTNLVAWFACLGLKNTRLVWGIRASDMALNYKRSVPFKFCSWVSSSVPLVIANSMTGLAYHETQGYKAKRHVVVFNGIDTDRFKPEQKTRERIRALWGIKPKEKLIGTVGRLDPVKGFDTFIKAAALLAKERKDVRFVCVGDGPESYKSELIALSYNLGLSGRLIWTGSLDDMPAVCNAFDLLSSSSTGEGFPNVIGEAMACDVPCVVTDVGDSAWIVGDTGVVVTPRDPVALAKGLKTALAQNLAVRCPRQRIVEHFSLKSLLDETERALSCIAGGQ